MTRSNVEGDGAEPLTPSDLPSSIPSLTASSPDTFKKRLVSALVLLPIAIIPTILGGWWFNALAILAAYLMLREWHRITQGRPSRGLFLEEASAVLLAAFLMGLGDWEFAIGILVVGAVLAHVVGGGVIRPLPWPGLGVLYVGLPVLALIWTRAQESGYYWVAWIFVVVWATDILAYIFGRTLGGPKLVPRFSPKKTWSGLLGGMIGGGAASIGIGVLAAPDLPMVIFALLGAIGAVVAQVGDVAESMLKRTFGVKDSGRLIPGHGGILDRVDGMVTTAVLLWIVVASADLWAQVL